MMNQQLTPERPATESVIGAPPQTAADVAACAERLERLTTRIAEFLNQHMAKWEDTYRRFRQLEAGRVEFDEEVQRFRQQRANWERHKEEQAKRIAEEIEALSQAWDHIETERRKALIEESDLSSRKPVDTAPLEDAHNHDPPSQSNLFDVGLPGPSRSAALQFQQIKREIRRHARRSY